MPTAIWRIGTTTVRMFSDTPNQAMAPKVHMAATATEARSRAISRKLLNIASRRMVMIARVQQRQANKIPLGIAGQGNAHRRHADLIRTMVLPLVFQLCPDGQGHRFLIGTVVQHEGDARNPVIRRDQVALKDVDGGGQRGEPLQGPLVSGVHRRLDSGQADHPTNAGDLFEGLGKGSQAVEKRGGKDILPFENDMDDFVAAKKGLEFVILPAFRQAVHNQVPHRNRKNPAGECRPPSNP